MATKLNPYIHFTNNAREAMEFYKSVFGGKLDVSTFKEFNAAHDPSEENNVMHAQLEAENGITLMGADTPKGMEYKPGMNVSMSLSGSDETELNGYFEKLSAGGTVAVPMQKQVWGDMFGMVLDKFGIRWMVNISAPKTAV